MWLPAVLSRARQKEKHVIHCTSSMLLLNLAVGICLQEHEPILQYVLADFHQATRHKIGEGEVNGEEKGVQRGNKCKLCSIRDYKYYYYY